MPVRKYNSLEDRIIANTILSTEHFYDGTPCWEWIGATCTNRSGLRYGKLDVRITSGPKKGTRKTWLVHRLALVVFKGRHLTRKDVGRHLCNYTLCANPAHLIGGSQRSNVRQCVDEGRHYTPWKKAA